MAHGTILIVDDDATIRDALAELLSLEGYQPVTAENGQDALDLVALESPDAILLDLQMPGLNGRDVAHELHNRGNHVPIVVMTATPRGRAWAKELNASDYLAKPFDLVDVLDTLDRVCSSPSWPSTTQ